MRAVLVVILLLASSGAYAAGQSITWNLVNAQGVQYYQPGTASWYCDASNGLAGCQSLYPGGYTGEFATASSGTTTTNPPQASASWMETLVSYKETAIAVGLVAVPVLLVAIGFTVLRNLRAGARLANVRADAAKAKKEATEKRSADAKAKRTAEREERREERRQDQRQARREAREERRQEREDAREEAL